MLEGLVALKHMVRKSSFDLMVEAQKLELKVSATRQVAENPIIQDLTDNDSISQTPYTRQSSSVDQLVGQIRRASLQAPVPLMSPTNSPTRRVIAVRPTFI